VNRTAELAQLDDLMGGGERGPHGPVLLPIVGTAGVGKTSLVSCAGNQSLNPV
jgi:hypothetical protein